MENEMSELVSPEIEQERKIEKALSGQISPDPEQQGKHLVSICGNRTMKRLSAFPQNIIYNIGINPDYEIELSGVKKIKNELETQGVDNSTLGPFDENGVLLLEKEIQDFPFINNKEGFGIHEEDIDADQDPVKKIVVETLITEGDEGLQDLVVIKPENGIVGNHGKMELIDKNGGMKGSN